MDILYFLKEKFDELRSLMLQITDLPKDLQKAAVYEQFLRKISLLNQLEAEYIYPEIRGINPALDLLTVQSIKYLEAIQKSLTHSSKQSPQIDLDLVETVKEYICHQESQLMPKLRMTMRTEDREDLGQVVVDAEEELLSGAKNHREAAWAFLGKSAQAANLKR